MNNKTMENKNIKDYMHLYLGNRAILNLHDEPEPYHVDVDGILIDMDMNACSIQLILRPLSDMSEDEALEVAENILSLNGLNLDDWSAKDIVSAYVEQWDRYTPEETKWLLSKGFDLFGLIESGLAIDKTKLTDHGN
jgi:hypothetical protein